MELITFECANCRQVLRVGADKAGKQAKCPRCQTPMQIPTAPASPSEAPAPVIIHEEPKRARNGEGEELVEIQPGPASSAPRPRPRDREDDFDDDRPSRAPRRHDGRDDDDYDDDRPSRAPRRRDARADDDYDNDRPSRAPRRRGRDDDYDDRPRKKRGGMTKSDKWAKVGIGLLIVAISACVMAGGQVLDMLGELLLVIAFPTQFIDPMGARGNAGTMQMAGVLILIGQILIFLSVIGSIVGYVFSLFAPQKNGAMGLAIATLAVAAVHLILRLIFQFIPIFGLGGALGVILRLASTGGIIMTLLLNLVFNAETILYPLFMQAVAKSFKERGHANSCVALMFLGGGYMAAFTFVVLFYWMAAANHWGTWSFWVMVVLYAGVEIIYCAFLATYIPMLFSTRTIVE